MSDILSTILQTKSDEIADESAKQSIDTFKSIIETMPPCRGFYHAIQAQLSNNKPAVIAEVKKASPSKGIIRDDFDPAQIAASYAKGGATCLSILTDVQYFKGHDDYLQLAKKTVTLPVLRKDFMIDSWQIYQSRALGADCILLIVAALADPQLFELSALAGELGMDVLIEVHNEDELHRALATPARLIGINNRNLKTFQTELDTSIRLCPMIPDDRIVVSESGIHSSKDLQILNDHGISTFLIGEAFMRHEEPGDQLNKLINGLI